MFLVKKNCGVDKDKICAMKVGQSFTTRLLTHPVTRSPIIRSLGSLGHPPTHPPTHSRTHSLTHPTHSSTPLPPSLPPSLANSLTHARTHAPTHSRSLALAPSLPLLSSRSLLSIHAGAEEGDDHHVVEGRDAHQGRAQHPVAGEAPVRQLRHHFDQFSRGSQLCTSCTTPTRTCPYTLPMTVPIHIRCRLVFAIRCYDQFTSLDLGLIHASRYIVDLLYAFQTHGKLYLIMQVPSLPNFS